MPKNVATFPSLVQRWMEAWNSKSAEAMCDAFAPDGAYEDTAFKIRAHGHRGLTAWMHLSAEHIPDLHVQVEEAFQVGHSAAVRWTFSGTPLMLGNVKGTGKRYRVPVITLMQAEAGVICRVTDAYNIADLLQQVDIPLGTFPISPFWRDL